MRKRSIGNVVKKDEFDSAIELLRGETVTIRTSLSDMKNDLIQALREENISLKNRIKTIDAQFESSDIIRNTMDQYSRRNDVLVDGIPSSVKKRELEDKCREIWGKIDIIVHESDVEACHCLVNHPKQLSVLLTENLLKNIGKTI